MRGGINYNCSEGSNRKVNFGNPIQVGGEGQFVVGSEFTPVWGWRAGIGYAYNSTLTPYPIEAIPGWIEADAFNSVEVFAGITLDWLDINYKTRKNHNWDFYSYLDFGYYLALRKSDPTPYGGPQGDPYYLDKIQPTHNFGMRGGMHVSRFLTKRFAIGLDGSILLVTDKFAGWKIGFPFDIRPSLGVCFTWIVGK